MSKNEKPLNAKILLIKKLHYYKQEFERVASFYADQAITCSEVVAGLSAYSIKPTLTNIHLPEIALNALNIELQSSLPVFVSLVQSSFERKQQKFSLKASQFTAILEEITSSNIDCQKFETFVDADLILSDFDLAGTGFTPFN